MNCPKCGAELRVAGNIGTVWECGSKQFADFLQSDPCKLTCAEKRIKELEDGLRPFAKVGEKSSTWNTILDTDLVWDISNCQVIVQDFRTAAKLLEKKD